ncbi:hypothetical protein FACS18948_2910 [Clostridia bacterium]|nr:hypothetical protein FACS18948_2910 [Clostridia bacterium]
MTEKLLLIHPSEEYIDEIHAYRQEFLDGDKRVAGVYGKFNGDIGD